VSVITIFRSRLRPGVENEYLPWAKRMLELVEQAPGFLALKSFEAPDGEQVTLVEFETEAAALAWRHHPEHLEAQTLGREKFYAEYELLTGIPHRAMRFRREPE